jgi:hypothetical protein
MIIFYSIPLCSKQAGQTAGQTSNERFERFLNVQWSFGSFQPSFSNRFWDTEMKYAQRRCIVTGVAGEEYCPAVIYWLIVDECLSELTYSYVPQYIGLVCGCCPTVE